MSRKITILTRPLFQDPPAPRRGVGKQSPWQRVIKNLKERPNEWALVARNACPSVATYVKSLDPNVTAVSRNIVGKRADIYAIYQVTVRDLINE